MSNDIQLVFETAVPPSDENATIKAYTLWTKTKHAITHAFPDLHKGAYYKQIQLYGTQKFWELTWIERLNYTSSLGETDPYINSCWAAMIAYQLNKLWPHLDNINEHTMNHLVALHRATNRIKGSKFHGICVANKCIEPDHVEGFIDIYADISSNGYITRWATDSFLAKNAIKPRLKS